MDALWPALVALVGVFFSGWYVKIKSGAKGEAKLKVLESRLATIEAENARLNSRLSSERAAKVVAEARLAEVLTAAKAEKRHGEIDAAVDDDNLDRLIDMYNKPESGD